MGPTQSTTIDGQRLRELVANMLDAMSGAADGYTQFETSLDELERICSQLEPLLAAVQRERAKLRRMQRAAQDVDADFGLPPASTVSEAHRNGQPAVPLRRGKFAVNGSMTQAQGIERVLREAAPSPLDNHQLLAGVEALGVVVNSSVPTRRAAIIGQRARDLVNEGRLPIAQVRERKGIYRWTGAVNEEQA